MVILNGSHWIFTEAINNSNLKKAELTYSWLVRVWVWPDEESNGRHGWEVFKSGIKRSCLIKIKGHEEQNLGRDWTKLNFSLEWLDHLAMHAMETLQSGCDWNRSFLYDVLVGWDCNGDITLRPSISIAIIVTNLRVAIMPFPVFFWQVWSEGGSTEVPCGRGEAQ